MFPSELQSVVERLHNYFIVLCLSIHLLINISGRVLCCFDPIHPGVEDQLL